ncbi:hypothetical protein Y032_0684g1504 [Ancylostoma ceylanicum]|uniref:Uncharacterized protein n=1 Tax=Ancylostoma ceylanicum TaxID=53326 RepID=A0A016WH41_9BILA|nr:hypothetical protein Y032_0684g1504 [Ancylostoma ceylanicum]
MAIAPSIVPQNAFGDILHAFVTSYMEFSLGLRNNPFSAPDPLPFAVLRNHNVLHLFLYVAVIRNPRFFVGLAVRCGRVTVSYIGYHHRQSFFTFEIKQQPFDGSTNYSSWWPSCHSTSKARFVALEASVSWENVEEERHR